MYSNSIYRHTHTTDTQKTIGNGVERNKRKRLKRLLSPRMEESVKEKFAEILGAGHRRGCATVKMFRFRAEKS